MLSALRRSVLMRPRAIEWRTQQRAVSSVSGWRLSSDASSAGGVNAPPPQQPQQEDTAPSTDFDADAGDYVHKEVSIHDRQHVRSLSSADTVKSQEDDYNSSSPSSYWDSSIGVRSSNDKDNVDEQRREESRE